jgi:membrane protein YdbS with pleckstrin-like domain
MPIPRRLLDPDEEVLVDLHPHWAFLFWPAVVTVVAAAAVAALAARFHHPAAAVTVIFLLVVAVPAAWLVARAARWFGWSLVVTDRRLVLRQGVLSRDVVQLRLIRIAEVHCRQDLLQRLLMTGRLIIEVTGEERPLLVNDVRRPRELQRVVARQLDRLAAEGGEWRDLDRVAPPTPPRPAAVPWSEQPTPPRGSPVVGRGGEARSVSDQLIELDQLRRRGIVTAEEFAVKKAELLDRM